MATVSNMTDETPIAMATVSNMAVEIPERSTNIRIIINVCDGNHKIRLTAGEGIFREIQLKICGKYTSY